MKEFISITEYQLLSLAYNELVRRINKEEVINERTKREIGRDNRTCQNRLKMYNEQLEEIRVAPYDYEAADKAHLEEIHRFGHRSPRF